MRIFEAYFHGYLAAAAQPGHQLGKRCRTGGNSGKPRLVGLNFRCCGGIRLVGVKLNVYGFEPVIFRKTTGNVVKERQKNAIIHQPLDLAHAFGQIHADLAWRSLGAVQQAGSGFLFFEQTVKFGVQQLRSWKAYAEESVAPQKARTMTPKNAQRSMRWRVTTFRRYSRGINSAINMTS